MRGRVKGGSDENAVLAAIIGGDEVFVDEGELVDVGAQVGESVLEIALEVLRVGRLLFVSSAKRELFKRNVRE